MLSDQERHIAQRSGPREKFGPEESRFREPIEADYQAREYRRLCRSQYDGGGELQQALACRSGHEQGDHAKEGQHDERHRRKIWKLKKVVGADRRNGEEPRDIPEQGSASEVEKQQNRTGVE